MSAKQSRARKQRRMTMDASRGGKASLGSDDGGTERPEEAVSDAVPQDASTSDTAEEAFRARSPAEARAEAGDTDVTAEEQAELADPPGEDERFERAAEAEAEERPEEAAEIYQELLLEDPGNVRARLRLGQLHLLADEAERAAEHFEAAKIAAPNDPEVLTLLGEALIAMRRFDVAEKELRRA